MEEDIIKHFEELKRNKKHIANIDTDFFFNFVENLINRNKELEEKVNKYEKQLDLDYVDNNFIEKSKVREKIEFYKRYGKIKNSNEYVMSVEIEVLEELLEERR